MDRHRRFVIAVAGALAALSTTALAEASLVPLREVSWLSDEGRIEALTQEPDVSVDRLVEEAVSQPFGQAYPNSASLEGDIRVGAALFKTPLLLGGQAAKLGISCHSCHSNGRRNPHFIFPAISDAPGTADTTHSFFSETLGNGVFDPSPIPDLALAGKVDHDPKSGELERFLETLVVDEFAAPQPDTAVISALAAYVRALRLSGGSSSQEMLPRSAARDWEEAKAMVQMAQARAAQRQSNVARLLLAGARNQLAIIHERLLPEKHTSQRQWLVSQSRVLGKQQDQLNSGAKHQAPFAPAWTNGLASTPSFQTLQSESLYDRTMLRKFLAE